MKYFCDLVKKFLYIHLGNINIFRKHCKLSCVVDEMIIHSVIATTMSMYIGYIWQSEIQISWHGWSTTFSPPPNSLASIIIIIEIGDHHHHQDHHHHHHHQDQPLHTLQSKQGGCLKLRPWIRACCCSGRSALCSSSHYNAAVVYYW